jgi:aldose 1-epimerase
MPDIDAEPFGWMPDGRKVERVTIRGGGLTAKIINWGAVIQDLRLAGHADPLVLGFEDFRFYPVHSPYFGAIAGRYANRIAGGQFTIDGRTYHADKNFLGKHTLHGGAGGMGGQLWTLADSGDDFATLTYRSPDGEMGFPGTMLVSCTYRVSEAGGLAVELTAETDAPTLCNLATHSYFNLEDGGRSDVLGHLLQIDAATYLPVDAELIPTGDRLPVAGTEYDFRALRPIRNGEGAAYQPYDHNFCLSDARQPLRWAVTLQAQRSGVEMQVWTTEPGMQFYDGANVGREVPGLQGVTYGAHAGLCLEPQIWPDSPNHPHFPQAVLRPGAPYAQTTQYRFRLGQR